MSVRNTREDVVAAAGRLFAERGYHGTSMRALGRELGLLGSSLYAHVGGKQELLVEVVERGARFFEEAAQGAGRADTAASRLEVLIAGHIGVMLDHRAEVRTFLNEAAALDTGVLRRIIGARDRYESRFREVLAAGVATGEFRSDLDPKVGAIFILSILNAVDRWFHEGRPLTRRQLTDSIMMFVGAGIGEPGRLAATARTAR